MCPNCYVMLNQYLPMIKYFKLTLTHAAASSLSPDLLCRAIVSRRPEAEKSHASFVIYCRWFDLFDFYQSLALNSKIWEELTVQPSWGTKWPFDQHPYHHNFLQIVYKVERHLPHICTTSALWSWGMHPLLKKEQKIYIFVKSSRPYILHICPWHLSIKMIR